MTGRGMLIVDGEDFMPFVGIKPDKAMQDISQKLRKRVTYRPHEEEGGAPSAV